ncbi:MAG: hypothetical protein N2449_00345 [Bacteroidales bacterium]|nr:hypothetical protein [Bacteroidales bacterium]
MKIYLCIFSILIFFQLKAQNFNNEKQAIKEIAPLESKQIIESNRPTEKELSYPNTVLPENEEVKKQIILYQKMIAELEIRKIEIQSEGYKRRSACNNELEEIERKIQKLTLLIKNLSMP